MLFLMAFRAITSMVSSVVFLIVVLLAVTYYYLSHLKLPEYQIYYVCLAISLSNFGLYSVHMQFNISCQYLYRRFHYVNVILQQLLFDQPLSEICDIIEGKPFAVSMEKEFNLWNPKSELPTKNVLFQEIAQSLATIDRSQKSFSIKQILAYERQKMKADAELDDYVNKYRFVFRDAGCFERM